MRSWYFSRYALVLAAVVASAACTAQTPSSPSSSAATLSDAAAVTEANRSASRCVNVSQDGEAVLGPVNGSLGALPFPTTIGGIKGEMYSYITSADPSGVNGQGAAHFTLKHTFTSKDAARPGSFTTDDRAVCGVAGSDPYVCHVNDVLQIVAGDGVFANANGSLTNHGTIDQNLMKLTVNLRGRVCGDGL